MREPSLHLLYHEIRAGGSDYSYVLDQEKFARHLDLFVRLREDASCGPMPRITFDDGHCSDHAIALPLLQTRGLKAHFFITTGWTGVRSGYMGWDEVRELHDAGHAVGAHGWSHALLTHCKPEDFEQELSRPRLTLEDKLGASITTMSLPGGRYNARVLAACAEAGYHSVYTSHPKIELDAASPLVGRLNVLGGMTPESIRALFERDSPSLRKFQRQDRIKDLARQLLGDRAYMKLWAVLNRQEPDRTLNRASE